MKQIFTLKEPAQKKRLYGVLKKYGIILGIGIAYMIFVLITGWGIPCVFNKGSELIFKYVLHVSREGLQCPGCGISRMIISIVKLDFVSAFKYNPFLFITGPLLLAYCAADEIKYIITGKNNMGKWEIFLWVEGVLAIIYGILRNIFPI